MTGDKNLLMDAPLSPSPLKHIIFADKGKSQVLGLGKVAITKNRHMDKVMLVESIGYNLMSVSMLCDLDMVVVFGKYRCVVVMEADNSKAFEYFGIVSFHNHNTAILAKDNNHIKITKH